MHLCITAGQNTVEIADINLIDGYIPSMSKLENEANLITDECQRQPAIWFKVMVIETLSINCNTEVVSWNCITTDTLDTTDSSTTHLITCPTTDFPATLPLTPPTTPPSTPPPTRKYQHSISAEDVSNERFEQNGCGSDFTDAFDEVPDLVHRYRRNKINTLEFHSEIKRLLHLYVLRCIRLTVANIYTVRKCLDVQQSHIKTIEDKIIEHCDCLSELQRYRKEKRQKFIDELRKPRSQLKYTKAFADILSTDIKSDIKEYLIKVEDAQRFVDGIKQKLQEVGKTNDAYALAHKSLEASRTLREILVNQRNRCLEANDALRDVIELLNDRMTFLKLPFRRDSDEDSTQLNYIANYNEEARIRTVIVELNEQKLLATRVKESIHASLEDLENRQDTCGVDWSANATDVFGSGRMVSRSWQTLKQQVVSIISEKTHSLAKRHIEMCMKVIERSNTATYEKKLFDQRIPVLIRKKSVLNYASRSLTSNSSSSLRVQVPLISARNGSLALSAPRWSTSYTSPSVLTLSDQLEFSNVRYRSNNPECNESDFRDKRKHDEWHRVQFEEINDEAEKEQVCRQPCLPYFYKENEQEGGREMSLCFIHDIFENVESALSRYVSRDADSNSNLPNRSCPETNGTRKHRHEVDALSESPVAKCANVMGSFSADSLKDDAIAVLDSGKNYMKKAIDQLRSEITEHFNETCCALQLELKKPKKRNYEKLWLIYEVQFFNLTLGVLSGVYFAEYGRVFKNVCYLIDSLTVTDLKMNHKILVHMLDDQKRPQSACVDIPARSVDGKVKVVSDARFICGDTSMDWMDSVGLSDSAKPAAKKIDALEQEIDEENIEGKVTNVANCSISDIRSHIGEKAVKTMILKPRFRTKLAPAYECLKGVINAGTPYTKLQHAQECVELVTIQIAEVHAEFSTRRFKGAAADDILDAMIIFLCNFDDLPNLYTQISIVDDFRPPFLNDCGMNYAFIQILSACIYVIEALKDKCIRLESKSIVQAEKRKVS